MKQQETDADVMNRIAEHTKKTQLVTPYQHRNSEDVIVNCCAEDSHLQYKSDQNKCQNKHFF